MVWLKLAKRVNELLLKCGAVFQADAAARPIQIARELIVDGDAHKQSPSHQAHGRGDQPGDQNQRRGAQEPRNKVEQRPQKAVERCADGAQLKRIEKRDRDENQPDPIHAATDGVFDVHLLAMTEHLLGQQVVEAGLVQHAPHQRGDNADEEPANDKD